MGNCAKKQEPEPETGKSVLKQDPVHDPTPGPTPASAPAPAPTPGPTTGSTPGPAPASEPEPEPSDDSDIVKVGLEEYYDVGEEIGRGGFSIVLAGTNKETGQKVAIKCIQLSMQSDDDATTALKREIHIMRKVNHPNILKLYDVFLENDDNFCLVMEYVPGKELFERIISRGQYSEKHASNIIRQITSAIEYLHDIGIAHRDLKPENLLSSGDDDNEVIKIIDFGLSKKFGDEQLVTSVGSPGYVAPEVLTAETYDKSVDMWSVGVILYILLSGFPPFFAETSTELFKKIIDVKYDFDDPAWEDVSEEPKEIIRNLLVKEPAKRLTAKQLAQHPWVMGVGVGDRQLGAQKKMTTANLK